ncbi:glycoside hydrolase family 66 protein [Streptococcus loxodontisalivarius]|uniref:Dextranase n=1 Tax=Streptococcus loxodontisalivarius TaxID=1349415 RepID=A0ABS2PQE6_9STRE|nr:glycoside hydrolase family 66 protein [Streptococcus loxodontisalivarius]MBM7642131.1 dextranase [Streptococcus loxodontisalivarius]
MENKGKFCSFLIAMLCLFLPLKVVSADEVSVQSEQINPEQGDQTQYPSDLQNQVQEMSQEELAQELETSETSQSLVEEQMIPATDADMESVSQEEPSFSAPASETQTIVNQEGVSATDVDLAASAISQEEPKVSDTTVSEASSEEVQNLNQDQYLSDPIASKASYQQGQEVTYQVQVSNETSTEQALTLSLSLAKANQVVAELQQQSPLLAVGQSYGMTMTIPAELLENNQGYLVTFGLLDSQGQLLTEKRVGLSVEEDWTVFPRYAAIAGSPASDNSLLVSNLPKYEQELNLLSSMNINSYFFYDVYHTTTDPLPDLAEFDQEWNSWSHSKVETAAVKSLVDQVHESGAKAMLYNMMAADSNPKNPTFSPGTMVYNFYDEGYGDPGQPMTYSIKGNEFQVYYNPADKDWQTYIANQMLAAMQRYGFDGWQADTIGDNRVTSLEDAGSNDLERSFMMSDTYANFLAYVKEVFGSDYYVTLNDVNGENIYKTFESPQDVLYTELWPNGRSAIKGRLQTSYGDLKARIDQAFDYTGKSLVVAAYIEEPEFDYEQDWLPLNGAARDVKEGLGFQADAALLVDAVIAASGGYHMTLSAIANPKADLSLLQTAYYPTQTLTVSDELLSKLYNYQQFITAYENLLRGGLTNDATDLVKSQTNSGNLLSTDSSGTSGNQVWTFSKSNDDVKTIQLINLMGIDADWKDQEGYANNKTPRTQSDFQVIYKLTGYSLEEAEIMAAQTYLTSPDNWLTSSVIALETTLSLAEDGTPILTIQVPRLELWDMIFIKVKQEESQTVTSLVISDKDDESRKIALVDPDIQIQEEPAQDETITDTPTSDDPQVTITDHELPQEVNENQVEEPVQDFPTQDEPVIDTPISEDPQVIITDPEPTPVITQVVEPELVQDHPASSVDMTQDPQPQEIIKSEPKKETLSEEVTKLAVNEALPANADSKSEQSSLLKVVSLTSQKEFPIFVELPKKSSKISVMVSKDFTKNTKTSETSYKANNQLEFGKALVSYDLTLSEGVWSKKQELPKTGESDEVIYQALGLLTVLVSALGLFWRSKD